MDKENLTAVLEKVRLLAVEAGKMIMMHYATDTGTTAIKADDSPLTQADLASHDVLIKGLTSIKPELPVLSEEGVDIPWSVRQHWERYWLIDPLDGTKEFLKKNGEFTVNVALIEYGQPVMGVVYAPALGLLYSARKGMGSWRQTVVSYDKNLLSDPERIFCQAPGEGESWKVVGSRSHASDEMTEWLKKLASYEVVPIGSSLKFCKVAEGSAHIYPRLGLTSEWDTAAAHAVVLEADGKVVDASGNSLQYNAKESLLNPHFFVFSNQAYNSFYKT